MRLGLNSCIVILAVLGICLNYLEPNVAKNNVLYFTIQSNIWILGVSLIMCCFDWQHRKIPEIIFTVKFIFTVSITLTGIVYNLILAPQYGMLFGSGEHTVYPLYCSMWSCRC